MERTLEKGGLRSAIFGLGGHRASRKPLCAIAIAIASGKGGTGKSVLAASLAVHFSSRSKKVTLFDADLGVGNSHILQGISPAYTAAHVVSGLVELEDIAIIAPTGVRILPAGSGVAGLANLNREGLQRIARGFEKVERSCDLLLIDSAAGIADQTIGFLLAADLIVLVTTPDLTAMTDVYGLIKVIHLRDPSASIHLLVNRVHNAKEGLTTSKKIRGVAKRFLGKKIGDLGWFPEDTVVFESVSKKIPFILSHPDAAASKFLVRLAEQIESLPRTPKVPRSFSARVLSRIG